MHNFLIWLLPVVVTGFGVDQMEQFETLCMDLVNIDQEHREIFAKRGPNLPEDLQTARYLRCMGILTGTYSDEGGPNLDVVHQLFGGVLSKDQYVAVRRDCLEKVGAYEGPKYDRILKMYPCFVKDYRSYFKNKVERDEF